MASLSPPLSSELPASEDLKTCLALGLEEELVGEYIWLCRLCFASSFFSRSSASRSLASRFSRDRSWFTTSCFLGRVNHVVEVQGWLAERAVGRVLNEGGHTFVQQTAQGHQRRRA